MVPILSISALLLQQLVGRLWSPPSGPPWPCGCSPGPGPAPSGSSTGGWCSPGEDWIFSTISVSLFCSIRVWGPIWMDTIRVSSRSWSFLLKPVAHLRQVVVGLGVLSGAGGLRLLPQLLQLRGLDLRQTSSSRPGYTWSAPCSTSGSARTSRSNMAMSFISVT